MLWKSKFKKHRIQQGHRSPSIGILTLCLVFLNLTHQLLFSHRSFALKPLCIYLVGRGYYLTKLLACMKYHVFFSKSHPNMIPCQKNNGHHCVVISTSVSMLTLGTLATVSLCEAQVTSSEMRYWWHLTGLYSASKFMQVLLCADQVIGVKIT